MGFLWIGSEAGISRYDGYAFESFVFTESSTIGAIVSILEDRSGTLWAAGENGLFYWDEKEFRQSPFFNPAGVNDLYLDDTGNLWVCSKAGLFRVLATQLKDFSNNHSPFPISAYSHIVENIYTAAYAEDGYLYFGSELGLERLKDNVRETVWLQEDRYRVTGILPFGSNGVLWTRHANVPLFKTPQGIQAYPNVNIISKAIPFKNGVLALSPLGIEQYEIKGAARQILKFDLIYATDIIIDREQNIWISSWEGVIKCRSTPFVQHQPLDVEIVDAYSMIETASGELLIGSNHGMLFRKLESSFQLVFPKGKIVRSAELFDLFEDERKRLWIATGYQGIAVINGNAIHNITTTNGLSNNSVLFLAPDNDEKLWAGTENGANRFDLNSDSFHSDQFSFADANQACHLYGLMQQSETIWFYGKKGIFKLKDNLLYKDSITGLGRNDFEIRKIVADRKGSYWVATQGLGLLQCRISEKGLQLVKSWTTSAGLRSDILLDVICDKNNQIWISEYHGISVLKINETPYKIVGYDRRDGTSNKPYNDQKFFQASDETIWVYNTTGIYSFHPDSIHTNATPPLLTIKNVRFINDNNVLVNDINRSGEVPALSYDENNLEIDYVGVSLTDPGKNFYRYKLMGFDDEWKTTKALQVSYDKLQPGSYTFVLNAANNSGTWSQSDSSFSFSIQSPFWLREWFLICAACATIGVSVIIVRVRERRIKNREAEKRRITLLMAELENKALRAQMNPHFIFNSLNAIQECIVTERNDVAYTYLSKFSRLLRMILKYSEMNFVPLNVEVTLINLYLELESLRFNNSFNFSVEILGDLDVDDVMFPTMLTQPFIENAIWHGLLHKDGKKTLTVIFSKDNERLRCTIEDNGIGRVEAESIKRKQLRYESDEPRGISLIHRRAKLLQSLDVLVTIAISDVRVNNSEVCGTKVLIETPLDLDDTSIHS
ncbi:MAG TPA: histidine kinase [Ohtaekwangia sp.]|nr:histidine kinase [Ohtaekwangia sp.]